MVPLTPLSENDIMIDLFKIVPLVKGKTPAQTKVVVAMSGGVDSSVAAALLAYLGYQVVGVTLRLYSGSVKKGACCGTADLQDAKNVANTMGFCHYTLNYEEIFKKEVIEEFAESYLRGETPIPCVRCNQTVKFRDLLKVAQNLDTDVLVTGHYVRRIEENGEVKLYSGKDPAKDQTYFLFATTSEQLRFLRFPLGDFYKSEVRELAKFFGLNVADKADSQDICFVSSTYKDTIARIRPQAMVEGDIVSVDGRGVIGTHQGIANYTIGQRRGIGVSGADPLYVVRLDPEKNQVIVGPYSALSQNTLIVKELNWLSSQQIPETGLPVKVKLRSSHIGSVAKIFPPSLQNDRSTVILKNEHFAITPGQACVIYDNEQMLGGGWICHI